MSEYSALIEWNVSGPDFRRGQYSREHTWTFDGGVIVPASPSPHIVPTPWSNPANVDPEEAFVAAIASCHMLTWLFLAAKQGFDVRSYRDDARGIMAKGDNGVPWVSAVTLSPQIQYGAKAPSATELEQLHHQAHEQCFIANSVKTIITVRATHAPA
ncbi:MAG: peroxiredoxin [Verrucomicrobia bacterium]|nr:peroxiredoxin [Verrucomicrobiota bacterium]